MKKIIAGSLAVMMMATAFAGCGGSTTNDTSSTASGENKNTAARPVEDFGDEDNISLKVWGPEASLELLKKQCDDFKAMYPEKTINIEVVAQEESDAAAKVQSDGDTAADVFGFPSDQLGRLANGGYMSEVEMYADDVKANNNEKTVAAATLNGKLMAYPETADNGYYLVYDKSVVSDEQAQKFETALQACKDAGKKFIIDGGNGYYACMFMFTGGCQIDGFEEDGITQKFTEYNEDEVIATMQAFSKLFHDYSGTFQSLAPSNIVSGFSSGTCGAGINGVWDSKASIEALGDNYGAAKLPTINVNGEDKQTISLFGYKYIGVNAATDYPAAAHMLADYLTSEAAQLERLESLGWGPSNNVAAASDAVKNDPTISAVMEQAKYSVPQANVADQFWTPVGALGDTLISDKTDPADTDLMKKTLEETINSIQDV